MAISTGKIATMSSRKLSVESEVVYCCDRQHMSFLLKLPLVGIHRWGSGRNRGMSCASTRPLMFPPKFSALVLQLLLSLWGQFTKAKRGSVRFVCGPSSR